MDESIYWLCGVMCACGLVMAAALLACLWMELQIARLKAMGGELQWPVLDQTKEKQ